MIINTIYLKTKIAIVWSFLIDFVQKQSFYNQYYYNINNYNDIKQKGKTNDENDFFTPSDKIWSSDNY